MWARRAFGPRVKCYEVNCAKGDEPDMREYDFWSHDWILFDEASPEQVLNQKKLFQAQPNMCDMGTSGTNCHAYKVCLHRKPIIICSNDWMTKVERLLATQQEWLAENTFVIRVNDRLF